MLICGASDNIKLNRGLSSSINGREKMARRKKGRGRRAASALSPINKQGIKLATLMTEAGLAYEVLARGDEWKSNPANALQKTLRTALDPQHIGGKLVWTGIALGLVGKFTGFKKIGLFQLS